MRIRQVKPAFWSDSKLAELREATRLFYIGLWMIADDAGWLRDELTEIARDLYGYTPRAVREKRVQSMMAELEKAKRVVIHGCGHVEIPKMPDHQRLAGSSKQVRSVFAEHLRKCVEGARNRESPPSPAIPRNGEVEVSRGNGQERSVEERSGSMRSRALSTIDETEFQRLVPRPKS